jgi:hypothetical protein
MPAITAIDHTLIGVADLEAARAAWTRLGFTCTPRGRHIGWGTANYCIMFAEDYVELLGIVDATQFVNGLDRVLALRGEGLMGLAWTADLDAARADVGTRFQEPRALSRLLELPEGTVEPRFRLAHPADPGVFPGLSAFLCHHLTPEMLRRPVWLAHRNGARALEGLTVVCDDPAALVDAYGDVFGGDSLHAGQGRLDLRVGPHMVRFLSTVRFARRYPGLPVPAATPGPAVMTVLVDDLPATAHFLRMAEIPTVAVPGARLVVPPEAATGVILEFAVS